VNFRQPRAQMRAPENSPSAFLSRGRRSTTRTLIVCAGDSITRGVVSANYVEMLEWQFAADGCEFVNAGVNGDLAYNLLQRTDDVVACRPDVVTVLIGTNDVNATFSQAWEDSYRKEQKLPEKPTLAWYRLNVERIIDRLQAETDAKIALLDLPMLGEDLASEMNRRVAEYNALLRAIATEKQVTCLTLHARLAALLSQNHTPPPYEGKKGPVIRAWIRHFMQRKSWDAVSADHGLELLTDHIHLNDKAAAVVAALIGDYLVSNRQVRPCQRITSRCHPERSEGSRPARQRFFASLRMTKRKLFLDKHLPSFHILTASAAGAILRPLGEIEIA
jgi:acyl-CoA thioesterase I